MSDMKYSSTSPLSQCNLQSLKLLDAARLAVKMCSFTMPDGTLMPRKQSLGFVRTDPDTQMPLGNSAPSTMYQLKITAFVHRQMAILLGQLLPIGSGRKHNSSSGSEWRTRAFGICLPIGEMAQPM